MANKKAKEVGEKKMDVVLAPVEPKTFEVSIVGDSSLVMHRWSAKAKQEMRDKQTKGIKAKKTVKVPEDCFQEAKYTDPVTGREGVSAVALRSAIVDASRFVEGKVRSYLNGAVFILPDFFDEDRTPCVYLSPQSKAFMREDLVRVGGMGKGTGKADLRYRPEYPEWGLTLKVQYDEGLVTPEQIINLLNRAGFSIGLGEWSPRKGGEWGRFHVQGTNTQSNAQDSIEEEAA